MNDSGLIIFGEVLFDHFPDGTRILGGAPFNVAWHLQAFGQAPLLVSRVGADREGAEVRKAMEAWGLATDALQIDPDLPTGRVQVNFIDEEPHYEILHPAAFDAISAPACLPDNMKSSCLLYHGSLALRDSTSRKALDQIRTLAAGEVFLDVNLRPPWWQPGAVLNWVSAANWVKLNHHELKWLCPAKAGEPDQVATFMADHQLNSLLLTHGEKGAELFSSGGMHDSIQPENNPRLVDTVGAGDAFTAVFILGLARSWPRDVSLSRAQTFASAVCSYRGGTTRDRAFYHPFLNDWSME